jgi:hypothetical protein
MAPIQLVLLLSIGSFQAFIPGVTQQASPVFEDSDQGLKSFTAWARSTMGEPRFNQPPLQICVVGAVPFTDKGPYISKPIWESKQPVRALEPYSATFHYVEPAAGAPAPKPRTMKQAVELRSKPAQK